MFKLIMATCKSAHDVFQMPLGEPWLSFITSMNCHKKKCWRLKCSSFFLVSGLLNLMAAFTMHSAATSVGNVQRPLFGLLTFHKCMEVEAAAADVVIGSTTDRSGSANSN